MEEGIEGSGEDQGGGWEEDLFFQMLPTTAFKTEPLWGGSDGLGALAGGLEAEASLSFA